MHKLFDGEAKRFYRDQEYEIFLIYEEVKSKMIKQCNNDTTQNRMHQYLQNLSINTLMKKENFYITTGIEHLRYSINKYTPLRTPSHFSELSKI